jgi:hypothetical protein
MNTDDVDLFEKTSAQLNALHSEFTQLARKSPDGPVNKFKISFANTILFEANKVLGKKYLPQTAFTSFNEDDLPTNSDVALVLAQYIGCMEKYRSDNIHINNGHWIWKVDKSDVSIRTSPPSKLVRS